MLAGFWYRFANGPGIPLASQKNQLATFSIVAFSQAASTLSCRLLSIYRNRVFQRPDQPGPPALCDRPVQRLFEWNHLHLISAHRHQISRYYNYILTGLQLIFWFAFGYITGFFIQHFHLRPVSTEAGVRFAAILIFAVVMLSYLMFIWFIRREGQEAFRIKNELQLAHGIQKTLVPPIHMRTPHFEIYGRSDPSDQVGGDLVDALHLEDDSSVAYLADIAGHGLQAGILMGMLKTAARTALLDAGAIEPCAVLPSLTERLNRVLPSVKEPQMYATFAGFRLNPDGSVFYALAAHPPLLHYRTHAEQEVVEQLSTEQFPVGLLPVNGFTSDATTMTQGDLLIAVTDGILEACNKGEEEFGLQRLQQIIKENRFASLPTLSEAILKAVRGFGKQLDDQTLLLIRRL
jgi:serine phosphatase RsbU (regulator of sigma subunit)